MWSLIILFVLFISSYICKNISDTDDRFWAVLVGLFSILAWLGGTITLIVFSCNVQTISVNEKQTTSIVAINNGSESNGGYFLFSGYLNQSQVYYYFKQTDNDGFIQDSIPAKNAVIYQDTIDNGYITITTNRKFVDPDYANKYKHWVIYLKEYISYVPQEIEIHVPPNTILQEFKIDLNNN
jgi:hypothetical protein